MLEVINLGKSFADKKLFQKVNLKFLAGNTYGIIGANGVGKSTFLKIISGQIEPSEGQVKVEKDKRISVLSQNQNEFDDYEVTETVILGNQELCQINQEKNAIYLNPDSTEKDFERAAHLEEIYGQKGGWSAEADAQNLLSSLQIPKEKWTWKMKDLKASEKVKVLLAKSLFGNPDILIMDEPTNHLDIKAIRFLENFLANYPNLVIVISHDSYFLDAVCTNIVDIDFQEAKMFTGNYSFWKQSSTLLREMIKQQNLKKEEQIAKLKSFIAKFSANAAKSSQATSRKKSLEKIQIEEIKPSSRKYPFIKFDVFKNPGKQILEVKNLGYKNKENKYLFQKLNFTFYPGNKMAILGDDDLAKTKLLEILMGKEKNYEGEVIWGTTILPIYFPVNNDEFFTQQTSILDWISQIPLTNSTQETRDNSDLRMRSFLGRMLFGSDSVFKSVQVTSGGEKARLMFARMMLLESNFLVLDQPLEHLDSESIDSVIESLESYKSSLILTTYNQALLAKVANVILEISAESSKIFYGSLEEYEQL